MGSQYLGWILWQKEEERREDFNTAWILMRPINSCTSEQFKDIQEVISFIYHCKTMYCCRMTLPSTCTTSGTLSKCIPSSKVDWSHEGKVSEGTSSQCSSQPWTRCVLECDLDKPRVAPYKYTWKAHHNTVYWCNLKLAQRRGLQILSNSITCNYAFMHTAIDLYRKSGMHENWWRTPL